MARIWKESYNSAKPGGLPDSLPDVSKSIIRHEAAQTIIPRDVVFVSVCSFTFRFDTKEQLQRVLRYYEQKIVPTSRQPESLWSMRGGDHSEAERWFEKLPLFLREEPKRLKVVKALRDAGTMFVD